MDEIKAQVEAARKEGYTDDEIRNYLSSSEDPAHKEYAKTFGQQNDQSDYKMAPPPSQGPTTPLLNAESDAAQAFSDLPVNKQLAIGAGAAAGLTGLGLVGYAGKEYIKNKIANANTNPEFKRQNDLIAQKNAIAERNIALQEQGLGKEAELSPLEQARVEVEKAKAERIRQQLEMDKQLHEHKIKTLAQKATKATTPTPEELQAATAHEGAQSGEIINKALGPVDSRQTAEIIGKSLGMKTADELAAEGSVSPPTQTNAPVAPTQASAPQSMGPNVTEDNWANQTPQEQAQEKAPEAPIPDATSPQEAETIATVQKASETPTERISEPSPEIPGAQRPIKITKEAVRKAQAGKNQFLNNFGFDRNNPESPRSKAALTAFEMLRPDIEGKFSYAGKSGNPHGYEAYKNFITQSIEQLPEETQVFLAEAKRKALERSGAKPSPQKGSISPGMAGGLAAGAFAIPSIIQAKEQFEKGNYRDALMSAMQTTNFNPLAMAANQLLTTSPEEIAALKRMDEEKKKRSK